MIRQTVTAILIGILLVITTGCNQLNPTTQEQRIINVGMILARGGLGDRSFNDSAYTGLQTAQREFNIHFETTDFTTEQANLDGLRSYAQQKFDLIIGIGFENTDNIKQIADEFPESNFALIDAAVEMDNVASITYREQEGDFLMGILAALLTETNTVGMIGGMNIPPIQRIEQGFKKGVAYENDQVTILVDIADTFTEPETGKALALAQYENGADVIYNAAGRTGLGIIEAAKEQDQLTIGTSGDQQYLAPGNVVGNRPKRVDTAVMMLIEQVRQNQFEPGLYTLGLKEGGLAIGPFDEDIVTKDMLDKLKMLEQQIINGDIVVTVK